MQAMHCNRGHGLFVMGVLLVLGVFLQLAAAVLPKVIYVDAGYSHSLAIRTDSTAWHWGMSTIASPVQVDTNKWIGGRAGATFLLLQAPDSSLWISHKETQILPSGDTIWTTPHLANSDSWVYLAASISSAAGIKADSSLWLWGLHFSDARKIDGKWLAVAMGGAHYVALASDSTLWAWGDNAYGQVGDSTDTARIDPVQISTEKWSRVYAGYEVSFAIRTNGTVWAWGNNYVLHLDPINNVKTLVPTLFHAGPWKRIAPTSSNGVLAEDSLGALYSIAPLSLQNRNTNGWVDFRSGDAHWILMKSDSSLWTAGQNNAMQLGIGGRNNYGFLIKPDSLNQAPRPIPNWPRWAPAADFEHFDVSLDSLILDLDHDSLVYSVSRLEKVRVEWINAQFIRIYGIPGQTGQAKVVIKATDPYGVAYQDSLVFAIPPSNSLPARQPVSSRVWQMAVGPTSSYALRTDSSLWVWGGNFEGQLGLGDTLDRTYPVLVGVQRYRNISAGTDFAHAIHRDSTLWGWGYNNFGQVGNGSTTKVKTPVKLGSMKWETVTHGKSHALAITTAGALYAWGYNYYGQLGNNKTTNSSGPTLVSAGPWKSVAAGTYHSVGIKSDSTMWVWGTNTHGEMGQTISGTNQLVPLQLGTQRWLNVWASGYYSVALRSDSTLWIWGKHTLSASTLPMQIGSDHWRSATVGSTVTLAVRNDGTLWGWGYASSGLLLDQSQIEKVSTPLQLPFAVGGPCVAGYNHVLCADTLQVPFGWGSNSNGQLAQASTLPATLRPRQVFQQAWWQVSSYSQHQVALLADSTLWAWGANDYSQLGDTLGVPSSLPVRLGDNIGNGKFLKVSAGNRHSVAIASDSTIYTWGRNDSYQLGLNSSNVNLIQGPMQISTRRFLQISANMYHNLAIAADSTLWAWGKGNHGGLGNGTSNDLYEPTKVDTNKWIYITTGIEHNMGIRSDSSLWAWGLFNYGRSGSDSLISSSVPVQLVQGKWRSVSTADFHTMAIRSDGTLWVWGRNQYGEIGNGSAPLIQITPFNIPGVWRKAVAGYNTSYAIREDGSLWVWGMNNYGQLGVGTTTNVFIPTQIGTDSWLDIITYRGLSYALKADSTLWDLGWKLDHDARYYRQPMPIAQPWNQSPRRKALRFEQSRYVNFGKDSLLLDSLVFDPNNDSLVLWVEGADLVDISLHQQIDSSSNPRITKTWVHFQSRQDVVGIDTLMIYGKDRWNGATSDSGDGMTWVQWLLRILPENRAPFVRQALRDTVVYLGYAPILIDLDPVFGDPNSDPLWYSVTDQALTTATIQGSVLRIVSANSLDLGVDTLVVTATDTLGQVVTDTMRVIVQDRPVITSAPGGRINLELPTASDKRDAAGKSQTKNQRVPKVWFTTGGREQ